jgi:transcriptional regulator with GAF, ATPase, and Fis domain
MHPRLVGIAGPFQGEIFSLPEGEVCIGRDVGNQWCVRDSALSRRHCAFVRQGNQVRIRDLGSRNGSRVNSVPVTEYLLKHGDQLSIGSSLFVFLEDAGDEEHSDHGIVESTTRMDVAVLLPLEDSWSSDRTLNHNSPDVLPSGRVKSDLRAVLKIATAIGGIRDSQSLQWQLLGFVFDVIPAERGSVIFLDPNGEVGSTSVWDRVRGPNHPVSVSQAVLQRVVRERSGVLLTGPASVSAGAIPDTTDDAAPAALLCAPMIVSERVLGVVYLDSRTPTVQFDEHHLHVLKAIAHIAALALENLEHWEKVRQENIILRAEIDLKHDMVGSGPKIQKVFEFVRKVAPSDSTVLIQGESGTGKELVARAIHLNSSRAERPFVAINSAAITGSLLESELFGHEKGAFTGAVSQKKGKMELAEGGTLFLDEISELAPELQAKLLRVLQERVFERVGGTRTIHMDIRLVAATNKSLSQAVEAGEFRNDLFYRLNVVSLTLPPLRERREDIPQLAEYFLRKVKTRSKSLVKSISPEAMACLSNYDWPGNVRELENAIERAAVLSAGEFITTDDFPDTIVDAGSLSGESARYYGALKDFKKKLIQEALRQAAGSYIEAAKYLGLHPNSLLRLIRNLKIRSGVKGSAGTE